MRALSSGPADYTASSISFFQLAVLYSLGFPNLKSGRQNFQFFLSRVDQACFLTVQSNQEAFLIITIDPKYYSPPCPRTGYSNIREPGNIHLNSFFFFFKYFSQQMQYDFYSFILVIILSVHIFILFNFMMFIFLFLSLFCSFPFLWFLFLDITLLLKSILLFLLYI